MATIKIEAQCGRCDKPFKGATQEEVGALFDAHHAEEHPDLSPSIVYTVPTDQDPRDTVRIALSREIRSRLASSDVWAARAVEDGEPMAPERIAYRQELRTLLATAATSKDPESIEIPEPPANPAAKKA